MEHVQVRLNTAVIVAALVGLLLFSLGTMYGKAIDDENYFVTPVQTVTTPSTTTPVIAEVGE